MAYERILCPKCELSFGQEVRFYEHLKDAHDVSDPLALYLETFYGNEHPRCMCSSGCDDILSWAGWKRGFTSSYVRGHNAKVDSVYLDKSRQAEFAKKRKEGYASGQYSTWNKGLTKETSEKVAKMSAAISSTLQAGLRQLRCEDLLTSRNKLNKSSDW